MVVITLSDCPPKLRGDITKWMLEISTGVYVGNFSARVRKGLWKRVCENIKTGRAVMIYSTNGEQHFGFEVHNSRWVPEDFDGIKLIRHLSDERQTNSYNTSLDQKTLPVRSKAASLRMAALKKRKGLEIIDITEYIVLDIETTGLEAEKDHIIEIGALHIDGGRIVDEFGSLILQTNSLPSEIKKLTGISDEMLQTSGRNLKEVLSELSEFVGDGIIVCHNVGFDRAFLNEAFLKHGLSLQNNLYIDKLKKKKKKLRNVKDYKLKTIAEYLKIQHPGIHRALPDCRITFELFEKLKIF